MERLVYERLPLGKYPKKIEISAEEMHLAYLHRQATGEPIQSFIRRLIREHWQDSGVQTGPAEVRLLIMGNAPYAFQAAADTFVAAEPR